MEELAKTLGHSFVDPKLLELALTHSSVDGAEPNERLEFLGDAVLDLVVAEKLFLDNPGLREGDLTQAKAWIVSRKTLAEAALELGLWEKARKGRGLTTANPSRAILANLYEAVLGAIYLDGGLEPAKRFALATLSQFLARGVSSPERSSPKQSLQEYVQARGFRPPDYELLDERGLAHARAFEVAARIGKRRMPSAWGRTRKEAEHWAAHEALLVLRDEERRDDESSAALVVDGDDA
ncbi:MAG: ribonuclease III [Planctomycetota bacterium]